MLVITIFNFVTLFIFFISLDFNETKSKDFYSKEKIYGNGEILKVRFQVLSFLFLSKRNVLSSHILSIMLAINPDHRRYLFNFREQYIVCQCQWKKQKILYLIPFFFFFVVVFLPLLQAISTVKQGHVGIALNPLNI